MQSGTPTNGTNPGAATGGTVAAAPNTAPSSTLSPAPSGTAAAAGSTVDSGVLTQREAYGFYIQILQAEGEDTRQWSYQPKAIKSAYAGLYSRYSKLHNTEAKSSLGPNKD